VNVEARNLSVDYTLRLTNEPLAALKDVSFSVESGKFVCLIGASGCGKTTLLNVAAGLVAPSAGELLLDGAAIKGPGRDRAMVFQSAALLPWRTVFGNVVYGLEIQGKSREAKQIVSDLIDLVGLSGFEESFPRELSGGMQQRVNLARALATQPKLLLMDEPFASLDAQMREYMQGEIERIWQQTRQTTLFVTHSIDEAVFLADEIIVMTSRPGRIKTIVPVGLPRPRALEMKKDPRFHAIVDSLRDLLDREFCEMMGQGIFQGD
jgi:NitT/TauT family transport system ATP-binding protein